MTHHDIKALVSHGLTSADEIEARAEDVESYFIGRIDDWKFKRERLREILKDLFPAPK